MKILVATWPFLGHVLPFKRFVRAAIAAGHTVAWMTDAKAQGAVTDAGAAFLPRRRGGAAEDWGSAPLATWIKRGQSDEPAQAEDCRDAIGAFGPDVLVVDPTMLGAKGLGLPTVVLGVLPLLNPDPAYDLILQCGIRQAEMPTRFPNVAFIGPMLPDCQAWEPPPWWGELDPAKPLVAVTQGTIATNPCDLILPTVHALRDLPVELIVQSGIGGMPGHDTSNARFAGWYSWPDVLARASVFVTNGGWGGVQCALMAGCPMVLAGATEDKLEVGKRIGWIAGTGIALQTQRPRVEELREAVLATLLVPRFTAHARLIAAECQQTNAPVVAVQMIERLVADRGEVSAGKRRPDTATRRSAARPSGSRRATAPQAPTGVAASSPREAPRCTAPAASDTPSPRVPAVGAG